MNPASTRFAMEASKRRRQRKQQQLSESDRQEASNDRFTSGGTAGVGLRGDENVQREDKQNKDKFQPQVDLACAPTLSITFDDSTVSSKDFSKSSSDSWRIQYASREPSQHPSQVTTSNESFNLAGAMSISCDSKKSENNNKSATICTSSSTPRHRNLGPNNNKLRRDGTELKLTLNTTSLNHSEIANTPKKNNLSATPKHNTYPTPKQCISNDDSFLVMSAVTTLEQVKVLTEERDKYRSDVALFKGKLNIALEKKAAANQEKENAIRDFEGRLMKQAKELELAKAQKQYAEYQLKVMEKKMNEHTDEKVSSLRDEVKSVNYKMKESLEELARVQQHNNILKKKKDLVETKENALKNELKREEEDRNQMRSRMNENSERLQRMEIECQVSPFIGLMECSIVR
jgi:chromosome segregation ATPase